MSWKIAGLILVLLICIAGYITSLSPAGSAGQAVTAGTPAPLTGPDAACHGQISLTCIKSRKSG